jgi:hypothetical protein
MRRPEGQASSLRQVVNTSRRFRCLKRKASISTVTVPKSDDISVLKELVYEEGISPADIAKDLVPFTVNYRDSIPKSVVSIATQFSIPSS